MPAYWSHYFYGVDLYHSVSNPSIKSLIKSYSSIYSLGLQGPDFLFYHPLYLASHKSKNLASIMHTKNVSEFFCTYLTNLHKQDASSFDILYVYLCGLLAHYTLDFSVHPYVYSRIHYNPSIHEGTNQTFEDHASLESILDYYVLQNHNRIPTKKNLLDSISIPKEQIKVLSEFLSKTITSTYSNKLSSNCNPLDIKLSYFCMKSFLPLLYSKHGRRKKLVAYVEEKLFHQKLLSSLLLSDTMIDTMDARNHQHKTWSNPWDKSITRISSVDELYEQATAKYTDIMSDFNLYYITKDVNLLPRIIHTIGNNSYHSGLPL